MPPRTASALWCGHPQCSHCPVREAGLFADLHADALTQYEREIDRIEYAPNANVYHCGDLGEAILTIRSGAIKLLAPSADGQARIVRLLRPGDVTGLEALVGEPYAHDALALWSTQVCRIPVSTVQRLSETAPEVSTRVMRAWYRLVTQADDWIAHIVTGPARSRVARLLLHLAEPAPEGGGETAVLPTREDMAAMLSTTLETASRIVAEFRRNGLLTPAKGRLVSIDRAALEAFAEGHAVAEN